MLATYVPQEGRLAGPAEAARSLLGSGLLLAAVEAAWLAHRKAHAASPRLLAQVRRHEPDPSPIREALTDITYS